MLAFNVPRNRNRRLKRSRGRKLFAEHLEDRRLLVSPGSFDVTFGLDGDGVASVAVAAQDVAKAIALQSDGKVVLAGSTQLSPNGNKLFAYSRLTASGLVDQAFANSGTGFVDFGQNTSGADSVEITIDQKLVLIGRSSDANELLVAKLRSNGSLDPTFSTDGRVVIPFDDPFFPTSLAVTSDSKILVAGFLRRPKFNDVATIMRLQSNGDIDTSFGNNGRLFYESPVRSSFSDIEVLPDGRIVVVGSTYNEQLQTTNAYDTLAVRLLSSGEYDPGFGNQGAAVVDIGGQYDDANSIAVQADGKLLIAGDARVNNIRTIYAIRLDQSGELDNAFGIAGKVILDLAGDNDRVSSVQITGDNKILIAGETSTDGYVLRLQSNGEGDGSFGEGGIVLDARLQSVGPIALQNDGNIVGVFGNDPLGSSPVDKGFLSFRLVGGTLPTSAKLRDVLQSPESGLGAGQENKYFYGRVVAANESYTVVGGFDPPDNTASNAPGPATVYVVDVYGLQTKLVNPTPNPGNDGFGSSLDVFGGTVAVGDAVNRVLYLYDASNGDLLRTISSPSSQPTDRFGFSVSLDEERVIVGAPGSNVGETFSGRAYVFNTTTGSLERTISNPTPAADEAFGSDVAIQGNRLLVGALGVGPELRGEAYLFERTSGNLLQTLQPSASDPVTLFGTDVDLSNRYAVVGTTSGFASIFDAVTGAYVNTLFNHNPERFDTFGSKTQVAVEGYNVVLGSYYGLNQNIPAGRTTVFDGRTGDVLWDFGSLNPSAGDLAGVVAITESKVIVGAIGTDPPPYGELDLEGSVIEYSLSDGNVTRVLQTPYPTSYNFGTAIAVGTTRFVIGNPDDDFDAPGNGAAYLYNATNNGLFATFLTPPVQSDLGQFGSAVATNDIHAFVSDPLDSVGGVSFAGRVFRFDGTTGALVGSFVSPSPHFGERFGTNLAVNGEVLIVGAPGEGGASEDGKLYVFSLATGDLLRTLSDPTPSTDEGFGRQLALNGDLVFSGGFDDAAVYAFNWRTGALFKTFVNPAPNSASNFGVSISSGGDFLAVGSGDAFDGGGATYLYDIRTGLLAKQFRPSDSDGDGRFGLDVATDGSIVAIGDPYNGQIVVYDVSSGQLLQTVKNVGATLNPEFGHVFELAPVVPGTTSIGGYSVNATNSLLARTYDFFGASTVSSFYLVSNSLPTAINLTNNRIDESGPVISTVGFLSTIDPDTADTHTYSLVSGQGDIDNAKFAIVGNRLELRESADFETQHRYRIRVRTTDQDTTYFERYISILVRDRNDAPVLNLTPDLFLTPINEDVLNAEGTSVSNLIGNAISDADAGALPGIAVVAATGDLTGRWQYTLDSGTTWRSLGSVATSTARLLPSDGDVVRLRYVPNANFNGNVSLTYRAWDRKTGAIGGTANVSTINLVGGTTAFSTAVETATLTVTPVNDAPVINTSFVVTLPSIAEDTKSSSGASVGELLGTAVTDIDPGSVSGIAIVGVSGAADGIWQYTLNNGSSWLSMGTVSDSSALLLPNSGINSRIRFIPKTNFNGTLTAAYRAWDRTTGAIGGRANLSATTSRGGMTAFSTAVETATLTVTAVNDAPVLDTTAVVAFTPINEDVRSSAGNNVSTLAQSITDVDAGALRGIAITSVTGATTGVWQYTLNGGTIWIAIGTPSTAAALLLPSNGAVAKVRYVPNANFNGTVRIVYRAWDQTAGTPGGTANVSTSTLVGGKTAFSTALRTATLTVNPVNDAPVLGTPAVVGLSSINEDDVNSSGNSVGFLAQSITDVDAGALRGIAITSFTGATTGVWQYTLNGGTTWIAIGTRSSTSALLLPSNAALAKVRYVPNVNFNGTVRIVYRAWDQSTGTPGGTANVSTSTLVGGKTAFSTALRTATLKVNPV